MLEAIGGFLFIAGLYGIKTCEGGWFMISAIVLSIGIGICLNNLKG